MKAILRIKWENIFIIMLFAVMFIGWITFLNNSNVYTLALAVLYTFFTLIIIMLRNTIEECRKETLNLWK